MLQKDDFVFEKAVFTELVGTTDYWFVLKGEAKEVLFKEHCKQSAVSAEKVVYCPQEDTVGVKLIYYFGDSYTHLVENNDLKNMLKELIKDIKGDE